MSLRDNVARCKTGDMNFGLGRDDDEKEVSGVL